MASWAHGERERRGAVRRLRPPSQDLWAAVDRLVDRAPRISDLAFHGLHLLAARRYRQTGRLVPRDLAAAEKNAAVASLVAPIVLREARRAYDRTMVLMKGPEVAVKYRDPVLRPFGDLDLLVPDAEEARRALLAAGFVPAGSPDTPVAEVAGRSRAGGGSRPAEVAQAIAAAEPGGAAGCRRTGAPRASKVCWRSRRSITPWSSQLTPGRVGPFAGSCTWSTSLP